MPVILVVYNNYSIARGRTHPEQPIANTTSAEVEEGVYETVEVEEK